MYSPKSRVRFCKHEGPCKAARPEHTVDPKVPLQFCGFMILPY
jgi:hypothetical protein